MAALEQTASSAGLPAMAEVKQRAAMLTAHLDALAIGVERAHKALDERTAALQSMASAQARAIELEKERGHLRGALEEATRGRAELEKRLESRRYSGEPQIALTSTVHLGSRSPDRARTSGAQNPSGEARQRAVESEVDLEAGENVSLLDGLDLTAHSRDFRPISGLALMRRAPPRVSAALRGLDQVSLRAGQLLTGQPALRLGAFGYLVVIHMLLLLSQAACRHSPGI